MLAPFVEEIRTGKVKKLGVKGAKDPMKREWESGIFKTGREGEIWLSETGLVGDEVADKKVHGGPEKALFAYPATHYPYWQKDLQNETITVGAMGENLVIKHADESNICIGDVYKLGEAVVQVSQPRRPCWKPARRFNVLDFALRIQQSGLTGWYYRVLQEGYVTGGVQMELIERPYPEWTIAKCNEVMYEKKEDFLLTKQLASCELLAVNWQQTLQKRLKGFESNQDARVFGPNKEL